MDNATPMLRQYLDIKKNYPGTILFFRLGDFYEMFNEDAVVGSRELQITLTARHKDSANPIPMCGVPHHAAAGYIAKLVQKGYRVAICEQSEPAVKGTKLVKRDVVRVITPGTSFDEQLAEPGYSVFLSAISVVDDVVGAAFLELSTGEFFATEAAGADAWNMIKGHVERFGPKEIIVPEPLQRLVCNSLQIQDNSESGSLPGFGNPESRKLSSPLVTPLESADDRSESATEILCQQFGVQELTAYGIADRISAISAAAMCLTYARSTQRTAAGHISEIKFLSSNEFLILDSVTLGNLEVVRSRSEGRHRTLLSVIDETVTGMGKRLLNAWLIRPSIKRTEIQTRQAAVTELTDSMLRQELRHSLRGVSDLERLVGKLNLGHMSPRDLLALAQSIGQTPEIVGRLEGSRSLLLQVLSENIFELPDTRDLIARAITEEPPANLNEGGYIRTGFDAELDELRSISSSVKASIAGFEDKERERSGIPTLKVRFNNVFGYYIEISKAQLSRVPENYERRQTLANAERLTTPQLKEWETKVLGAEEKMAALETRLYQAVLEKVKEKTHSLQATSRALATLDALASLAETAAKRNYVAPVLHDGDEIEIVKGRHPVVETHLREAFVPNDIYLNNSTDRLAIVTGANMGGKSTILRQIALIQILAQIGSYVPAASSRLPIVNRIWTRVGASDDLASGRSTFMVEMTETAAILHNATPRSLVLLDEIGRGTSTFDGLSIAWAVAEYLHNSPDHSAKTVFATHYHELTELAENLPGAKNYQITATERDGEVVFLHKLEKGKASKSYGISVARLAGLPQSVIDRAKEVLGKLEQYELAVFSNEKPAGLAAAAGRANAAQFSLFAISNESAIDELRKIDLCTLSPDESKALLENLKKRIV
jgi:DNA mismatch repair protein MutS